MNPVLYKSYKNEKSVSNRTFQPKAWDFHRRVEQLIILSNLFA